MTDKNSMFFTSYSVIRLPYIFPVPLFLLIFCMPTITFGQSNPPEKQVTTTVPFSPIPKTTPSWLLSFRPRERAGIRLGKYFFMDVPAIGAGLKYEFQDETRKNNGVETTELYHRFAERVGFRSTGWVYNPALCTFSATLVPELSQVYEEDSEGNTARSNLFTPDYLLSATFLELKPYTLNLHANRKEMPSWAPYKGGFETRIHDFGGDVNLDITQLLQTSDFYHANLGYNRSDSTTDGFYKLDEINDTFFLNFKQQGGKLKTELKSFYTDKERITEDIENRTQTFDTQFFSNYLFRHNNRISLDGVWSYRNQDLDTVDLQTFRLNERLNWRHRKNLTSFYKFIYNYQDTNGSDESNSLALEGRVQHILFDNLTTTAGAETVYTDYSNGQEAAVDPYLGFLYTRPTPIGSLSLGSRWDYLLTNRDYDHSRADIVVQNEEHSLSFTQDSFLGNYNVAVDSIIVTNRTGTIQYIEGIDYEVEVIGNYVSIRSLSLGDIDNGQDVLVHYIYAQDSEYDDDIFTQQYNMAYTFFENTTLQVSHSRAKQHIIDGTPPRVMINDTVNSVSIQHRMGWSDTRLEVAEYDRASDVTYQTWQATQRISIHPLRMLNMSFAGYYGERNYNDQPMDDSVRYDSDFFGGTLTANWRINRRLLFTLEGFTNIREDDIENTVNTGLRAGLIFNYRIWTARLSYQLTNQSISNEIRDSSRLRNFVRFDLVRLYW